MSNVSTHYLETQSPATGYDTEHRSHVNGYVVTTATTRW